jgi:hypothetical protein
MHLNKILTIQYALGSQLTIQYAPDSQYQFEIQSITLCTNKAACGCTTSMSYIRIGLTGFGWVLLAGHNGYADRELKNGTGVCAFCTLGCLDCYLSYMCMHGSGFILRCSGLPCQWHTEICAEEANKCFPVSMFSSMQSLFRTFRHQSWQEE